MLHLAPKHIQIANWMNSGALVDDYLFSFLSPHSSLSYSVCFVGLGVLCRDWNSLCFLLFTVMPTLHGQDELDQVSKCLPKTLVFRQGQLVQPGSFWRVDLGENIKIWAKLSGQMIPLWSILQAHENVVQISLSQQCCILGKYLNAPRSTSL